MLSATTDFEGGTFRTLECDGKLMQHPFERGEARPSASCLCELPWSLNSTGLCLLT